MELVMSEGTRVHAIVPEPEREAILGYMAWVVRQAGGHDWRLSLEDASAEDEVSNANAYVATNVDRHEAKLHLSLEKWPTFDQEYRHKIITHEAFHLVMWGWSVSVGALLERLYPFMGGNQIADTKATLLHEEETHVDALAEMFLRIHKDEPRAVWDSLMRKAAEPTRPARRSAKS